MPNQSNLFSGVFISPKRKIAGHEMVNDLLIFVA
jgi:hypothetical protein